MEIELEKQPARQNWTQSVPVFMINLPGNYVSDYYTEQTRWSWANRGYTLNFAAALKAEDPYYQRYVHKFTTIERTMNRPGKRDFYKTEISRFLSHVKLWQTMLVRNWPRIFIVEHDCMLQQHISPIWLNNQISFIAAGTTPAFYTGYTKPGIKTCTGYHLRRDYCERLVDDFLATPYINFNIEKYLYVMSIFDLKYSASQFLKTDSMPATELYDAEIGNTVKDDSKIN